MALLLKFDHKLDFFLPKKKQGRTIVCDSDRNASIKDTIESCGVPHTEVGKILFEKKPVHFSFLPQGDGLVRIQGVKPPMDVTQPSLLRPDPFPGECFIADVNVMRLGKLMILMGFDVSCSSGYRDEEIADISEGQSRIVLTRDTGLLKRKKIRFARRIRSEDPYEQLREVILFFGLEKKVAFFSRCTRCNLLLVPVEKEAVLHRLEPKTRKYFNAFYQCPGCRGIFWKGSHHDNMVKRLTALGALPAHFP